MTMQYLQTPQSADAVDTLVGINYFAGWWPETPNKWQDRFDGHDWRSDYAGRVPLLGEYNCQETMDREIVAAADHGVDFFAILWYPIGMSAAGAGSDGTHHERNLNRAVDEFMASPHAARMRFYVEFCNHPPFYVVTDEDWNRCARVWLRAMGHPSYLRVGGRLVFKIHSGGQFYLDCGKNVEQCRARLDDLRGKARAAGLGEMVIAGGNLGPVTSDHWASTVFDFGNDYMVINEKLTGEEDHPYETEVDYARELRRAQMNSLIPYMAFTAAGWNPRPWHDPRPKFALPDRAQWKAELERMARDVAAMPNLGIPLTGGARQKVFTIYAWNEFGEGGFVAPTRGESYMKLECIKEVFGVKKP
ncbi:MAG: hypothetical protein M1457_06635 [bacterium]|nr:hypothetical protein [bacterium]